MLLDRVHGFRPRNTSIEPVNLVRAALAKNLTLGYDQSMPKKTSASKAASELGRRSAAARRKAWGEAEFKRRMKQYGKLGGRPRGSGKAKQKGGK